MERLPRSVGTGVGRLAVGSVPVRCFPLSRKVPFLAGMGVRVVFSQRLSIWEHSLVTSCDPDPLLRKAERSFLHAKVLKVSTPIYNHLRIKSGFTQNSFCTLPPPPKSQVTSPSPCVKTESNGVLQTKMPEGPETAQGQRRVPECT